MIEISKFIIVDKIFNESECCKIIDSKSEFIKSPEEQQNNKKSIIVPDESNYTFGHTNFPYWSTNESATSVYQTNDNGFIISGWRYNT